MSFFNKLFCFILLCISFSVSADWKPTKPITVIVPWAAGGSTDQIIRITAAELESSLGQKIVVINQPGATGSIGTKNALEAPKDGYTWASGAAPDLGGYPVLGMLDTKLSDWHLFLVVANVAVVSTNASTPYKDMKELLDAMKEKAGQVSVATAGVNSSGHKGIEAISRATGIKYKHVTYDGGNPAVVATVAGETEVTTQLAVEQADMIRAKKLRPLAVISDLPVEIEGYGKIEPLSKWVSGFKTPPHQFGIFIPKGVPQEVITTMAKIWNEKISKSEAIKKYALNKGAVFTPVTGDEAYRQVFPAVQANTWAIFDAGKAKASPETFGIPRPR